jgi:hypothetical protein
MGHPAESGHMHSQVLKREALGHPLFIVRESLASNGKAIFFIVL